MTPRLILIAVLASVLAACAVGPNYHRPEAPTAASYKEDIGWKASAPQDMIERGAWWTIYDDPVLDGLERQIAISNQTLKAAEAAFRQSRALVSEARAGFFPTVTLNASGERVHGKAGSTGTPTGGISTGTGITQNQYNLSTGASWELDLWGRIRRTVEGQVATAEASAADLASARLSAQAALATAYFQLRAADELKRLLGETVAAYRRSLTIVRNQYAAGIVAKTDVITAETQLLNAEAQAAGVGVARAQFEHAIAVLIGKPPADFALAPTALAKTVPIAPVGVPSTLLERRPDIAAAERTMAAANAQIGVAVAAFFPNLTLSGNYGFQGSALGSLVSAANQVWAFGPALAETLFAGGLHVAELRAARATYDQTVALYRQTVLVAFQGVEDQLAALHILAEQAKVQEIAVQSARHAVELTLNQYKAGTVPYTNVVVAQTTQLATEQSALATQQSRLVASVALINALGGGWTTADIAATMRD